MLRSISLALTAALVGGCAQWKEAPEADSILATPKPSPTSSILDIGFVSLPMLEDGIDWTLWNDVDEQVLSEDLRRELAANGLRVGRISGAMPDLIAEELQAGSSDETLHFLEQANLLSDVAQGAKRIYCRPETRHELPVRSQIQGEVSLLTRRSDFIVGHSLIDPLFQFSLETRSGPHGETIVRLVPEVAHGNIKQAWVTKEQAIRLDARRDSHVFKHLAIEIPLKTGEAIVVSPTSVACGLGEQMLIGERIDEHQDVVAVFVRLTQEPRLSSSSN